jgi:hypothetical protein
MLYMCIYIESWDSTVGIATGYELDDQGVGVPSPGRAKKFDFSISSRPSLLFNWYQRLFLWG